MSSVALDTEKAYFCKLQHQFLNCIGYIGLSRFQFFRSKSGQYKVIPSPVVPKSTFIIFIGNTLVKVVYLIYLLFWQFKDMDFLDKMTIALYFLLFGIMALSYSIWLRQHPFYEIVHRFWTLEESMFSRLGNPQHLKETINRAYKGTVAFHMTITWIGCACFVIQYCGDPKYYTFLYATVEGESTLLWVFYGIHEFIFMQHCWYTMCSCNSCFTFHAILLANFLAGLSETATKLCKQIEEMNGMQHAVKNPTEIIVRGTGYNIERLLKDYQLLMLLTQQYNSFVSYKTVFLHACGYCQFIADVFLAVQVLRLPGTNVVDIWFYIEDSLVSMYMIYRVYKYMARVQDMSVEFFRSVYLFLQFPNPKRKKLRQVMRTLILITLKLGPCSVTVGTVLAAMDMLSNYYLCVALW